MSEILMEMPVHEARGAKYMAGKEGHRQRHGMNEGFIGNPILEAHDEGLDGVNYAEECENRNHSGDHAYTLVARAMYHAFLACVFMSRALFAIREGKKPSAALGKFPVASVSDGMV